MYVNCYDGNGFCLFAVRLKEGIKADMLGDFISRVNNLIDFWGVANEPEGAVIRY